jgi:hypothetical protein
MKAASRLSQYRSKPVVLLDNNKEKPDGHDKFVWVSQDNSTTKIGDIDDGHLINIYKVLSRTKMWLDDCITNNVDIPVYDHGAVYDGINDAEDQKLHIDFFMSHIGYEIYKRGLLINQFEKFKIIEDE